MKIAVVLNPVKVDDPAGLRDLVAKRCADAGWEAPVVVETTVEEPGTTQARKLAAQGADVVVAAGGDGTVRAVCEGLAGTTTRLALVPAGTGNLLARNLGVPLTTPEAVDVAVDGTDRRIDVGVLEGGPRVPDGDDGRVFAVMAGVGLDAAMMEEVPDALKGRVGWPAYVVGGLRALRRPQVHVEVVLDHVHVRRRTVRTVLVGNVGTLQGGVTLLPDARPDDGELDVALVSASRPADWVRLVVQVLRRRPRRHGHLETHRASRVEIRLPGGPTARQLDGELVAEGRALVASVRPGALVVRVPAGTVPEEAPR